MEYLECTHSICSYEHHVDVMFAYYRIWVPYEVSLIMLM